MPTTRLNDTPDTSPYARLRILTSSLGILKDWIIIFIIALSNDNQSTYGWYMCLPGNTHQFHVQHDFSSKRLVLVRAWQKYILSVQSYLNHCKSVINERYLDICKKQPNVRQKFTSVNIDSKSMAMPRLDFINKDLPSALTLMIADQIVNDSRCCSYTYN